MSHYPPSPIEPDGIFDGILWGCVIRGALVDLALSIVAGIPLAIWLAGVELLSEDPEVSDAVLDSALASPEGLFWGALLGLLATVVGAFYGANRAGGHYIRHGGWVAMTSLVLGMLLLLVPGGGSSPSAPVWYDFFCMVAMLPAGILGGYLAQVRNVSA